jgi:hypothetical protein
VTVSKALGTQTCTSHSQPTRTRFPSSGTARVTHLLD